MSDEPECKGIENCVDAVEVTLRGIPVDEAHAGSVVASASSEHDPSDSTHRRTTRPVYQALLDPEAVRQWMVPDGMTSQIHTFEGREGGSFRITLTYDLPTDTGKTDPQSDTFHGRFVELVPNELAVQVVEVESEDPEMSGEMTITYTLTEAVGGGTDLVGLHENLPPGVPPEANELGWRMSIDKLAGLVEDPHADE